ncbi:hypothetical protein K502DRAFT_353848, partial [Neoconidiobolus thromboides FSU 785]
VISIGGIFDIPSLVNRYKGYKNEYIIPAFGDDINKWKKASPQFVSKESLKKINYNQLPNYLLIDSQEDTLVNTEQTTEFASHLKGLGFNNIQVVDDKFGDHNNIPQNVDVVDRIYKFLV